MIDKAIVTIQEQTSGFCGDFELQTTVRVEELMVSLLNALISAYPAQFAGTRSAELYYCNKKLMDDQTLASNGIWDGSVLDLRIRR